MINTPNRTDKAGSNAVKDTFICAPLQKRDGKVKNNTTLSDHLVKLWPWF